MRKITTSILTFLLLVCFTVRSQTMLSPLELSKKIFSSQKFDLIKTYSTGDYKDYYKCHPDGRDLNRNSNKTFFF